MEEKNIPEQHAHPLTPDQAAPQSEPHATQHM